MPTDDELSAAYGSWYRPDEGRFSGLGDALLRRLRGSSARRIDKIAPAGAILDVGSGDGTLLDALHARGRAALGLERASNRDDVLDIDIADVEGEYAAVVFWHSLEHLRDPAGAIESAHRLLAPTGVIVIAVPNVTSLQAQMFGDNWLALDLPRHLTHFSARALVAGLEQAGLRVERTSYVRGGQIMFGWLHGCVKLLPGHPDLYDAVRRPDARNQPMSASKRALTLLATCCLLPFAALATLVEVVLRRSGTVYVEARLTP